MRFLLILLLLIAVSLLVASIDDSDGARAYREGRFADALAFFTAGTRVQGHDASPEWLHNQALAALRAGELVVAEIAAEKAAARGNALFIGLRDFVLGNVAFVRCERADLVSRQPESGPPALDAAIAHAESAAAWWQRASMTRSDWPEARRNAERAAVRLRELKDRKEQAERKRQANAGRRSPRPLPTPTAEGEQATEAGGKISRSQRVTVAVKGELSPQQVRHLLEMLAEKEVEKRRLREKNQRVRTLAVERDW
jgi:hypothetical protein